MIAFPKARSVGWSLLLFTALVVPGCCTCRERYGPFLKQVEDNLRNDIRPKYAEALEKSGRPSDLMANDLGLVDDSADSLERVRLGGLDLAVPQVQEDPR